MADSATTIVHADLESVFAGADPRGDDDVPTSPDPDGLAPVDKGDIPVSDIAPTPEAPPPDEPKEAPPTEAESAEADIKEVEAANPAPVEQEPEPDVAPKQPAAIPSYRLAEETAKRRAAEDRVRELEQHLLQQPPPPVQPQVQAQPEPEPAPPAQEPPPPPPKLEFDFGDRPKEMFDKVLDGNLDAATELFGNTVTEAVNKALSQIPTPQAPATPKVPTQEEIDALVANKVSTTITQQKEFDAEDIVIERIESGIPQFNPRSPEYDSSLVDETIALQNAYLNMPNAKYTRAEAMDKAASVAMMTRGIAAPADISAAGTRQSAEDAAPAPEQKKAAVERNVAAQNQQPPAMPSAGSTNVEPTIDISTLTEEEFEALPEATLARLRGDLG